MRRAIIITFILSSISNLYAQSITKDSTGDYTYVNKVAIENTSKSTLHERAMLMFSENYGSGEEVIDMNTPSVIVAKALTKASINNGFGYTFSNLHYTITLKFKDNKYMYTIGNIYYSTEGVKTYARTFYETPKLSKVGFKWKEEMEVQIEEVALLIESELSKAVDDW